MGAIALATIKNALATWVREATGLPASRLRWAGQNAPEPDGTALPWLLFGRFSWSNPGSDWVNWESNPLVFTAKPVTLDAATDTGTSAAHDLQTRDGPFVLETTGSLAGSGLAVATNYWAVRTGTGTLRFAASFPNADAGTYIDITGAGTGTHTLVCTADTRRAGQELVEIARGARRVSFDIQCFPAQPLIGQPFTDDMDPVSLLSDVVANLAFTAVYDKLAAAGIGILKLGDVQALDGVQNSVYFEPRALLNVVFSTTSELSSTQTIIDYLNAENEDTGEEIAVDLSVAP